MLTLLDGDKDDNDYFATPSVGIDYIMLTLLDGDKDDKLITLQPLRSEMIT